MLTGSTFLLLLRLGEVIIINPLVRIDPFFVNIFFMLVSLFSV